MGKRERENVSESEKERVGGSDRQLERRRAQTWDRDSCWWVESYVHGHTLFIFVRFSFGRQWL